MLRPSMLFGVAVLTAGACGPTPTAEAPVAPAASISTDDVAAGSRPPAVGWRYHPKQMADITDGVKLSDDSWLLVGELGERWRTEPLPSTTTETDGRGDPTYFATTTIHRAPERIERILRWSAHRWLFVGESGSLYGAPTALGPLTSSIAPPIKLHRIAGSEPGLVGLDALGQMYRFDGSTWSAPQSVDPTCSAPAPCPRLFDVATTQTGKLLGLAIPERLLASDDGGKTWTEQGSTPIGTGRLLRSADGGVLIEGASQSLHWPGSGDPQVVTEDLHLPLPTDGRLALLPRRGPSTVAIDERRAILSGDRYYEVFADPEGRYLAASLDDEARKKDKAVVPSPGEVKPNPWMIASGSVDAPLAVRRLELGPSSSSPEQDDGQDARRASSSDQAAYCEAVRLAARGDVLLVACMRESDESVIVDLHRSTHGGEGLAKVATLVAPDDDLSLAVAADGSALIAGACLATPPAEDQRKPAPPSGTCDPQGPIRLPAGRGAKPVDCAAGDLTDRATAVTYSVDGQGAYFFGRRAKDERIALFVSRDAGQTFFSRPLVAPKGAARRWDVEREGNRTIHPTADGRIGMVLGSHPPAYVVADREGRISGVARLPDGATSVSGHGAQVLSVGPNPQADDGPLSVVAWESTDGGLTFRQLRLPTQVLVDELDEPLAVRCGAEGCVIGSRMTRVGWNHPQGGEPAIVTPPGGADRPLQPALRTPIACSVETGQDWVTIADIHRPVLPAASHAMRGTSFWSTLRYDDHTGVVTALTLPIGAKGGRLHQDRLLGKVGDRSRYGYHVTRQMEGYAAARVALPAKRENLAGHPIKMDLGWTNYQTNTHGKATLKQLGALRAADVTPGSRPHLVAGLLSVSPRGLLLRPSTARRDTVVVNLAGAITHRGTYPSWPSATATESHSDAVLVGSVPLAVGMFAPDQDEADTTVALARLAAPKARATFFRVAPERGYDRFVGTWWSYRGDDVGLVTHVVDVDTVRGYATFTPFTGSATLDTPIAVPTQLDLPSGQVACTETERRGTPRINAPFAPGTRHPLLLQGAVDSHVMLTERAILHGTPAAPCVAAFFAREIGKADGPMVAILSGDLKQAWLFRQTPSQERSLDYRRLRCSLSPGASLPARLWHEPGMVRR